MALNGRLTRGLDLLSTLIMTIAALTVIVSVVRPGLLGAARRSPSLYKVGERFPDVLGPVASGTEQTLVLWLNTKCKYCEESAELYRRLGERRHRTRLVIVGSEPIDELRRYVTERRFAVDSVLSIPSGRTKLSATPTILLISQDRTVRRVWMGKIVKPEDEQALFSMIS
jgi:predicted DCC family thiol-disulfide oxidoreductase YuxK